jgi:hypothetical protein
MQALKDDGTFQTFIAYFLHLLHLIRRCVLAASAATKVVIKRKLLPGRTRRLGEWRARVCGGAWGQIDSLLGEII